MSSNAARTSQDVRGGDQPFVRLVGVWCVLGDLRRGVNSVAAVPAARKQKKRNGGEIVGGESEQQCSEHAIRVCCCAGYRTQLYAGG